jgi:hypothetical protein
MKFNVACRIVAGAIGPPRCDRALLGHFGNSAANQGVWDLPNPFLCTVTETWLRFWPRETEMADVVPVVQI